MLQICYDFCSKVENVYKISLHFKASFPAEPWIRKPCTARLKSLRRIIRKAKHSIKPAHSRQCPQYPQQILPRTGRHIAGHLPNRSARVPVRDAVPSHIPSPSDPVSQISKFSICRKCGFVTNKFLPDHVRQLRSFGRETRCGSCAKSDKSTCTDEKNMLYCKKTKREGAA